MPLCSFVQLLYSIRRKPKEHSFRATISDQHTAIEVETEFEGKKSWRRSQFLEISSSNEFENVVQYRELESDLWVRAVNVKHLAISLAMCF